MATLPKTITHPVIKDSVTFIKTAAETGGAYTTVLVKLPPGGGNQLHYHTTFTEYFEVMSGCLGLELNGKKLHLQKGESCTVQKYEHHRFFNDSTEPVVFKVILSPARHFEACLRIMYGLANDGKVNAVSGLPRNLWHLSAILYLGETYLPNLPLWLQKRLYRFIYRIGKRRKSVKALEKYYVETEATGIPAPAQVSNVVVNI